ncbi:unnamed protein product [Rotaria sp. Silwood2]|nr:unnamed protein product [Rotaria sp. Silwood2]CAF3061513.1 unnamed protein product [Rotaria sp. Silwood2]CAF4138685.1 unnamed protein product [Rotaria sp. Silwood2]CAF4140915.1 unnamed protein product [Rotaria sp. Silwood2]
MQENRLQMLFLSPFFCIPIMLLALSHGRSRSTYFYVNSIVSKFVLITSGIMIVYYTRKLTMSEVNNNQNKKLLLIVKRFLHQWIRSIYVFERFRVRIWRKLECWFSLINSNQCMKLLPIKSAFISSYNCNRRHMTTSGKYIPFTNKLSNVDVTQTFSEMDERDSNSLYIEEEINPSTSYDTVINRSLSSPIKFYTADRKFFSHKKPDFNKLKMVNVNMLSINNNLRSDSNQLIFSKNMSTPSVTSVEFILTPTCSTDKLEEISSNDNKIMIDTIQCTSNLNCQYSRNINNNKISISSSFHGLRSKSSRFILNSFHLISKRRFAKWNQYLTDKRHRFF